MEYAKKMQLLSEILRKSKKVNSFDKEDEREADTLAHSLLDMEQSFKTVANELLPKLSSNNLSEDEINDVLFDIGEHLRHILYHIKDPQFYKYMSE